MPQASTIKSLRCFHELTVQECAGLIYISNNYWEQCEEGQREMHQALWELFNLKVGKYVAKKNGNTADKRKYGFHDLCVDESWTFKGSALDIERVVRAAKNFQYATKTNFLITHPADGEVKITRVIKVDSGNRKYAFHDLEVGQSWSFQGDKRAIGKAIQSARGFQYRNRLKFDIKHPDDGTVTFTRVE